MSPIGWGRWLRWLGCVCWVAMVLGCASPPATRPGAEVLSGRLSVQVEATESQTARGFSGQFELRGNAGSGSLELSSPLGGMLIRARWSDGVYLLDDGRTVREYTSLDALAQQGLGEPLPLAALFDWLRGRPWAGAQHQERRDGQAGFEQMGWIIDTGDLDKGQVRAARTSVPAVTLRVKLDHPGTS